jgi:protein translocase SecG subunit
MFIPALLADVTVTKTSTVTGGNPPKTHSQLLKTPTGKTVQVPPIALPPGASTTLQLPPLAPKTPLAAKAPWLTHSFAAFFVMSAIALVVLLAVQTTKQEGLSGTLGGRVESAYRPRLGFDQQLQRITTAVAVSFVLFGLLVSLSGI